jgi:hypothetical protein
MEGSFRIVLPGSGSARPSVAGVRILSVSRGGAPGVGGPSSELDCRSELGGENLNGPEAPESVLGRVRSSLTAPRAHMLLVTCKARR